MTSPSRGVESSAEASRLLEIAAAGFKALQELQERYDADMWGIQSPEHAKIRHVHLHLSKTLGKLAGIIEPADHVEYAGERVDYSSHDKDLAPVIADLLMHCAQITNLIGGSMGDFLGERYKTNSNRFAPESVFASLGDPESPRR
ncbi:hypothetical protein OG828_23860 [Streptomyces sp. NBC_00457]|uniref:hypothetical protein n=1 Tax=Streptomyces sp. NBC_00457 TaxID=2975748 RepID=UPI002E1E55A6